MERDWSEWSERQPHDSQNNENLYPPANTATRQQERNALSLAPDTLTCQLLQSLRYRDDQTACVSQQLLIGMRAVAGKRDKCLSLELRVGNMSPSALKILVPSFDSAVCVET